MVGGDETAVERIAPVLATMEANSEAHKQRWTVEFAVAPAEV
jgi:6-phosphogluconate dehydrogenase (decarboxylating)